MDTARILTDLRTQRDRITAAITALEALNLTAVSQPTSKAAARPALKTARTGKRVISAEARQRMALAQQKRWAKKKRAVKAAAKKAARPAALASVATTSTKTSAKPAAKSSKGGLTAAGRKRLSEATKARWAAKRAAAKTSAATKSITA